MDNYVYGNDLYVVKPITSTVLEWNLNLPIWLTMVII